LAKGKENGGGTISGLRGLSRLYLSFESLRKKTKMTKSPSNCFTGVLVVKRFDRPRGREKKWLFLRGEKKWVGKKKGVTTGHEEAAVGEQVNHVILFREKKNNGR